MGDEPRSSGSLAGLRFLGVGLTFAVLVGAGWYLGDALDSKWGIRPWGTTIGSLLGVALGTFELIRTASALDREGKERK